MEDGDYVYVLRKLEEYLKDVKTLNQSLIARECWSNDQVQEVQERLITVSYFSSLTKMLATRISLQEPRSSSDT